MALQVTKHVQKNSFITLRSLIDGGCGIVRGWKKYQKLIVGGLEKTESFNSRDGGGAWVGF